MKQTTYTCDLCGCSKLEPSEFVGIQRVHAKLEKYPADTSKFHLCAQCFEGVRLIFAEIPPRLLLQAEKLGAESEREACAKLAENMAGRPDDKAFQLARKIARAIRERSKL